MEGVGPCQPRRTPCPIPGIVDEDNSTSGPASSTWSNWFGGWLVSQKPSVYSGPARLTIAASAPADGADEKYEEAPSSGQTASLVVRPAMLLEEVYAAAKALRSDQGDKPFAVCNRSTRSPVTLSELHSGINLDLYIDTTRARPEDGGPIALPPGPPPKLIGRNADDLLPSIVVSHLRLMKSFGPVFKMALPGDEQLALVADPELIEQIMSNPEVWGKIHMKNVKLVRVFGQGEDAGLFTSDDDMEIWGLAHRILLPAFSNQGMKAYFSLVQRTVDDLFTVWDSLADANEPLELTKWSERFTFDVIGRVAFSQNFESIRNRTHPYLTNLERGSVIAEAMRTITAIQGLFQLKGLLRAWETESAKNRELVMGILEGRKAELAQGVDPNRSDLLTLMLTAKDPRTGRMLPEENIVNQILTFLFAGHDSTSTAITFLLMNVAMHGEVERKILEEVERVVGDGPLTFAHLGKLEYCTAVINESLRMFPPAQAIRKTAVEDTTLGPYNCPKGTGVIVSIWALAHNPDVWPDPWRFDPDRWLESGGAKTRNSFSALPFSYGPRACIGRALSIMEQRVILCSVVRRYYLRLHPHSRPTLTTPLFLKPSGICLSLEKKNTAAPLAVARPVPPADHAAVREEEEEEATTSASEGSKAAVSGLLLVLYGSNMGQSEAYAAEVAQQARGTGLSTEVMALDAFLQRTELAKQASAVVVVSSTYNGQPPDNATAFCGLLSSDPAGVERIFSGVHFAVFGCGNSQWNRTYQAVPSLIDQALEKAHGVRLAPFSSGDADSNLDEAFEAWKPALWTALRTTLGIKASAESAQASLASLAPAYSLEPSDKDATASLAQVASDFAKRNGLFQATVLENRELQEVGQSGRSTRHVELQLPSGLSYVAGDHLAVYGGNPPEVVEGAAQLLGVELDDVVEVALANAEKAVTNIIPLNVPLPVRAILTWCVELQQIATRSQISYIIARTSCPPERVSLEKLLSAYETEVLKARRTVLELLGSHRSAKLSLADFLTIQPPLKPRYYSISSSPRVAGDRVSVSVGLVQGISPTGRKHLGVCSNFLAKRKAGEPCRVFIKDTKSTFRLPQDGSTPVILVGPGTGLAPLRGFLQDREASKATGAAMLFFGCRNSHDYIYREELEAFKERGVLTELLVAFSRPKDGSPKVYVQHLIAANAERVGSLLREGAHVYVCGDAKAMAPDVRAAINAIIGEGGVDKMVAAQRYHEDVWAS